MSFNAPAVEPKVSLLVTAAGFIVMLAGLLGYITSPGTAFEAMFVIGLVFMIVGYSLQMIGNRVAVKEAEAIDADEEANGFFYIMDPDYSAPVGDAVIEDLTKR